MIPLKCATLASLLSKLNPTFFFTAKTGRKTREFGKENLFEVPKLSKPHEG
jgi:hypothetical protein